MGEGAGGGVNKKTISECRLLKILPRVLVQFSLFVCWAILLCTFLIFAFSHQLFNMFKSDCGLQTMEAFQL